MVVALTAGPLVRVKAKVTVKNAIYESLWREHTAILTVIFTLTRTSGAALMLSRVREADGHWDENLAGRVILHNR